MAQGRPKTVAFHTLGCRVNQYESEAMKRLFEEEGYLVAEEGEGADVYVVNTCTVTALADRKSRQFLRRAKKQNPAAIVCATGCYVQASPEAMEELPEVDIFLGTDEKYRILEALRAYEEEGEEGPLLRREERSALTDFVESGALAVPEGKTRAGIKIEDGCDRFCTYCIIPRARGPVRSRRKEAVLEEARRLVAEGYRELVLTGINTALYEDLPGLLRALDEMEGDFRLRLASLEPTVVDLPFVEEILRSRRLCHHLHLSLQSGSERILRAMGRSYSPEDYLRIVELLKRTDPLFNITTDMIVGFPGEREEDHRDSLALAEKVGFGKIHVFPYSRRQGTPAAAMSEQIPSAVKKERAAELASLGERLTEAFCRAQLGSRQRVLPEERRQGLWTGYTDHYLEASFPEEHEGLESGIFVTGTVTKVQKGRLLLSYDGAKETER